MKSTLPAEPKVLFETSEYEVTLIVSDSIADSEPNSCTITVIEPLQTDAKVLPQTINLKRHGRYVIGRLVLPEGVKSSDINQDEPLVLIAGDAEIAVCSGRPAATLRRQNQHACLLRCEGGFGCDT